MDTGPKLSAQALARQPKVMPLQWTGRFVPQIGQRVRVTSQGSGVVIGYFAADRQLGVHVTLDAPDGPWTKERAERRHAAAFGHQLDQEAPDQEAVH